jgi:integrase
MATTLGKGSIIQMDKSKTRGKCRKWRLKVSTGRDPRTGKYSYKAHRFEGTYTQAKAALRDFIGEVENNAVQARTDYTFEEYCDQFVELRRAGKEVSPTTLRKQETYFRAACRHIGKAKLEAVTPTDLNKMYVAMLKGDTLTGRKVSGAYVNGIHVNIKLVFDQAVREGIITSNPCLSANPPRIDTEEKKALSPEQVRDFVSQLDPRDDRDCAFLLAIAMGMRRGEICGLSWGDVDFARGIVDVSHSYDELGNLKGTKTKAGMRLLPMPESIARSLMRHKEAQLARFEKTNSSRKKGERKIRQADNAPVIADIKGDRVMPGNLSHWWNRSRGGFGLEGWSLHELRHSYLSLLAFNGVHPKVMQALAGHSSSKITMDIYTHVNMDAKRMALEAVSSVF